MHNKSFPTSTSAKLDEILAHLRAMDKRDRMRTFGGFIKSLITIIPMLIFIWGIWYAYAHGEKLLEKIAEQAAKQAAILTEQQGGKVLKQFENFLSR